MKNDPVYLLPPSFGTTLMPMPPPTESAVPDEYSTTVSAAVPMSGTKLLAHAEERKFRAVSPLTMRRWSNGRLPCIENVAICMVRGPPTPWRPPVRVAPGTRTAIVYWLLDVGSASTTEDGMTLLRFVF